MRDFLWLASSPSNRSEKLKDRAEMSWAAAFRAADICSRNLTPSEAINSKAEAHLILSRM